MHHSAPCCREQVCFNLVKHIQFENWRVNHSSTAKRKVKSNDKKGTVGYRFSAQQWHHRTAPAAACLALTLSSLLFFLNEQLCICCFLIDLSQPLCYPSDLQLWLWGSEYLISMTLSKVAHILHKWSSERWNQCLCTLCHLGWSPAAAREKGDITHLERKKTHFFPLLHSWKRLQGNGRRKELLHQRFHSDLILLKRHRTLPDYLDRVFYLVKSTTCDNIHSVRMN